MAVTRQVNEAQVGVLPVDIRQAGKGHVALPAFFAVALVKTRRWAPEVDDVDLAIAREVHELVAAAGGDSHSGQRHHGAHRAEAAITEVGFVVPGTGLLGEYA